MKKTIGTVRAMMFGGMLAATFSCEGMETPEERWQTKSHVISTKMEESTWRYHPNIPILMRDIGAVPENAYYLFLGGIEVDKERIDTTTLEDFRRLRERGADPKFIHKMSMRRAFTPETFIDYLLARDKAYKDKWPMKRILDQFDCYGPDYGDGFSERQIQKLIEFKKILLSFE
ncbi:MAG: hypothetical protein LBC04_00505 [Holosporaceae bacterium]|jgi:hypothetical protein|nr:hypothetical protein [Holosporaceae bacterium]